jgi:DNA-binding CsgD family transcriptional regulator
MRRFVRSRKEGRAIPDQLNAAIATLYQGAVLAEPGQFQNFAFESIGSVVPCSSAMWMVGVHVTSQVNSVWYHKRQPIDVARYVERYGDSDVLRQRAAQEFGTPFRIEDVMDIDFYRTLPIYTEASRPGGIEYAMAVVLVDPVTSLLDFLVLYRDDRARPFTDEERAGFAVLAPHMVTAWRQWQLIEMLKLAKDVGEASQFGWQRYAVVDDRGAIHVSDGDFGLAMREAFPGWSGAMLPQPLIDFIGSGEASIVIGPLDFHLVRKDQRHILTINGHLTATPLSDSELRTARLFAEGRTHKEIATALGLSHYTVRNQIASAYTKLGVHSKVALARLIGPRLG